MRANIRLLPKLLYRRPPYPLPTVPGVVRVFSTALIDDNETVIHSGLAAYQCGSCRRMKKFEEMYVKKDGVIGAQCQFCHDRQQAKKSPRHAKKRSQLENIYPCTLLLTPPQRAELCSQPSA